MLSNSHIILGFEQLWPLLWWNPYWVCLKVGCPQFQWAITHHAFPHDMVLYCAGGKGKEKERKESKIWGATSWKAQLEVPARDRCLNVLVIFQIQGLTRSRSRCLKQLWNNFETTLKPQKAAPGEYRGGLLCVGAEPPWLCHRLSVCIHISLSHSLHEFCWVGDCIVTLEKNQSIYTDPSTHHPGLVLHGTRLKRWGNSKCHRCGREFGRARTFRRGRLLGLVSFRN